MFEVLVNNSLSGMLTPVDSRTSVVGKDYRSFAVKRLSA